MVLDVVLRVHNAAPKKSSAAPAVRAVGVLVARIMAFVVDLLDAAILETLVRPLMGLLGAALPAKLVMHSLDAPTQV